MWWTGNTGGPSGRLRSKLKLSGFLAKKVGSVLVATELTDDAEGLAAAEDYMHNLLSNVFSRTHVMQGNSLGIFSVESRFRQLSHSLMAHPLTDKLLVVLILINMASMTLVAETGNVSKDSVVLAEQVNLVIGYIFVIEIALRIVQLGFVRGVSHADGTYTNQS